MPGQAHNKERTAEEYARLAGKIVRDERAKRRKIAAAGIDYDFPGFEATLPQKAKRTKFAD